MPPASIGYLAIRDCTLTKPAEAAGNDTFSASGSLLQLLTQVWELAFQHMEGLIDHAKAAGKQSGIVCSNPKA